MGEIHRVNPNDLCRQVVGTVANFCVLLRPLFLHRPIKAPERLRRRLMRRQVIFGPFEDRSRPFRHDTYVQVNFNGVRIVSRVIRLSIRSRVTAVVRGRAVSPVILPMSILTVPLKDEVSPLQATLANRIGCRRVSDFRILGRLKAQVYLPNLDRPSDLQVNLLRDFRRYLANYVRISAYDISPFIGKIRKMGIDFTMRFLGFFMMGEEGLLRAQVAQLRRHQAAMTTPYSQVKCIRTRFLFHVVECRTTVTQGRQLCAMFTRALRSLFLRDGLPNVPTIKVKAAPAFRIVRRPPNGGSQAQGRFVSLYLNVSRLVGRVIPRDLDSNRHREGVSAI